MSLPCLDRHVASFGDQPGLFHGFQVVWKGLSHHLFGLDPQPVGDGSFNGSIALAQADAHEGGVAACVVGGGVVAVVAGHTGQTQFFSQLEQRRIDRLVFGESAESVSELRFLESVTHPRIKARLFESMDQARKQKVAEWFVVSLLAMFILVVGGGNVHGQRTHYDIEREESIRNRQPSVSHVTS